MELTPDFNLPENFPIWGILAKVCDPKLEKKKEGMMWWSKGKRPVQWLKSTSTLGLVNCLEYLFDQPRDGSLHPLVLLIAHVNLVDVI